MQEVYDYLKENIQNIEIKQNEIMAEHISFKVGGKADIWIKVKTIEQLIQIIKYANTNNIPITILGNGSNVLVKDKGIRGITLQLDFQDIQINQKEKKAEVLVEAGMKLGKLAMLLQKKEIAGFEFASRYSRYHRWCYSYECWGLWQGNERNCKRSNMSYGRWNNKKTAK